jgi:APA family basic amino acid/polyamine antiporter
MPFQRRPRRQKIPNGYAVGILISLGICTLLYILFSYVLTGVASYEDFRLAGKEASVAYAIQTYMPGTDGLLLLLLLLFLPGFHQ